MVFSVAIAKDIVKISTNDQGQLERYHPFYFWTQYLMVQILNSELHDIIQKLKPFQFQDHQLHCFFFSSKQTFQ